MDARVKRSVDGGARFSRFRPRVVCMPGFFHSRLLSLPDDEPELNTSRDQILLEKHLLQDDQLTCCWNLPPRWVEAH